MPERCLLSILERSDTMHTGQDNVSDHRCLCINILWNMKVGIVGAKIHASLTLLHYQDALYGPKETKSQMTCIGHKTWQILILKTLLPLFLLLFVESPSPCKSTNMITSSLVGNVCNTLCNTMQCSMIHCL